MATALEEMLAKVRGVPAEQKKVLAAEVFKATGKWYPSAGPQSQAYYSKADQLLFGGEPGGGKLLALDTPIPTPCGWSTMGDLRVGDQVFDESGSVCNVVAKSAIESEETFRLTFSDGAQIVAGARHQWVTSNIRERDRELRCSAVWRAKRKAARPSRSLGTRSAAFVAKLSARNTAKAEAKGLPLFGIRTTEEIARTLRIGSDGRINHSVRVAGPLVLPATDVPIDPYLLGTWLGDGTSSGAAITIAEEEMAVAVNDALPDGWTLRKHAHKYGYGIVGGMKCALRTLGVLGNKHIPSLYLRTSKEQRLALLQGLMDTDGYADPRGQCEISLTRKILVDGVLELILSLGIKAALCQGVATLNGRVIGPKYRIKFITELPVFRLARKLIRQKRANFRGTHELRYIVGAEAVAPVPMQCIQVDSPGRQYLCGWQMIPTHNSSLVLGLAFTQHQRSLIMRRNYGDLARLIDDALKIHGSREGFNGSPPPKLKISDRQVIDFVAANRVGDEQSQMGQGHDFIGIDEATHFAESQVRFVVGWLRAEDPAQRKRVVLATNPPLKAEGMWVIKMFAPWLDPRFPSPAKPGELRWVVTGSDGQDIWVDGPEDRREVVIAGERKIVAPLSRTYIPSKVSDNPYYAASDYERQLDAMQEPYRSLLMGGFRTAFKDDDYQVIPTAWITEAQARWQSTPPHGIPQCAIGVDGARVNDQSVLAIRHDGWYAPLISVKGSETPHGTDLAALVLKHRRDNSIPVIDVSESVGAQAYAHLKDNGVECHAYRGIDGTSRRTKEKMLGFFNKRAESYWRFREALDPGQDGGSPIALPDDPELVADLTAPTWELAPKGIKIISKEKLIEDLGRSPDKGDAVVMAWAAGPTAVTHITEWRPDSRVGGGVGRTKHPGVNLGARRGGVNMGSRRRR